MESRLYEVSSVLANRKAQDDITMASFDDKDYFVEHKITAMAYNMDILNFYAWSPVQFFP